MSFTAGISSGNSKSRNMARLLFPPHYLLHSPKLKFSSKCQNSVVNSLHLACHFLFSRKKFQWAETPLRSTMGDERLSSLALLHVHRDIDINVEDIMDEFNRRHPRRLQLANILS